MEPEREIPELLKQIAQRQRETIACLNQSKISEVVGVVYPNGPSGCRIPSDEKWTLQFAIEPWRFVGGELQKNALKIQKLVTDAEINELQNHIKVYDVLRVRLKVMEGTGNECAQGLLIEIVNRAENDKELIEIAKEKQKPVTITDQFFGSFTLIPSVNWFETEATWKSKAVKLRLSMDECEDVSILTKLARSLWASQDSWDKRIRDYAVVKLLNLKNAEWLGDDEHELTPAQFQSRMSLESVVVYPNGHFTFDHSDGDLFWGHSISVAGTLSDGPSYAGIEG